MPSKSRVELENWLKTIHVHGHVLDVGGSQKELKGRTKDFDSHDYVILDLPTPHEKRAEVLITLDIQEKLEDKPQNEYYTGYFDQVFCLEVSEYWHDPVQALKNINQFMKPFGELYISFHWTYGIHKPEGEDCLRYTENAVKKILHKTGFEIQELTYKRHTSNGKVNLFNFYNEEGMKCHGNYLEVEGYLIKAIKI